MDVRYAALVYMVPVVLVCGRRTLLPCQTFRVHIVAFMNNLFFMLA